MKKKILVVIANYYTNIADELLKSALNELKNIHQTKIINVPGVFEIPVYLERFALHGIGFRHICMHDILSTALPDVQH